MSVDADPAPGAWSGFVPEAWRSRITLASIPNVRERLEELFDWDSGTEYPYDHRPRETRLIERRGLDDREKAPDEAWQAFWERLP